MKRLIFERLTNPVEPLPVVKDEYTRIREHIAYTTGWDTQTIDQMLKGYNVIMTARRKLGLDK